MRVITHHDEITNLENGDIEFKKMIVRQYEIKDECSEVTILASGDIKYNNVTLKAKSEGTVEKFYKINKPIGYTMPQMYDNLRHPIDNYKKDRYDTAIQWFWSVTLVEQLSIPHFFGRPEENFPISEKY